VFQAGDVVLLKGQLEEFRQRDVEPYLEILPPRLYRESELETASVVVLEAVLAPRSPLSGRTLRDTRFRDKYGMNDLAMWHGYASLPHRLVGSEANFRRRAAPAGASRPTADAESGS